MAGRTLFTVLEETAARYGDAAALHQPSAGKTNRRYRTYSWNDWARASREIARGLLALGLRKGEVAAILSETRAEFYLVDLGIMGAGGVAAALYTAYPPAELARNLVQAQPRFLFVEDTKTLASLKSAVAAQGGAMPQHVIVMTGETGGAMSLDDLRTLSNDDAALQRVQDELTPEDSAILYLTSGATGEPKMGLTSHAAILANIDMAPEVLPVAPQDSMLVFLPSAHIAQRIVLELVPMRMGTPVWFSESLSRLPGELRSIRPTIFLAPPRVWEKMYAAVQTELNKRPRFIRKLLFAAIGAGARAAEYRQAGKTLPGWLARTVKIADRFVFSKVRERLGGRIRIAASGAAPLGKDLAEFFAAIGLPIVEGYGLTEAGVITLNPLRRPKPGSIGKLLPGVEARVGEDGELEVRTPCIFKGYYRDAAATRSVMTEDGWFSTGDIAEVDDEGYWYITGRKKEVIISSNGKKIYPARIENLFKMEPVVNQVLLIGDKKPYVTALLTTHAGQGEENLSRPVDEAVSAAVSRVNQQLADFERIRRFKVLQRDFSIEHGELTPTMKIRRAQVLENHRELISELYPGRDAGD